MSEYWREQKDKVFEALDLIEEVLDDYDENAVKALPNFDADKFYTCMGIRV